MEGQRVVPFVGILTSYGDPITFDLIYEGMVDKAKVRSKVSPVYVVVESIPAAVSFAESFRAEFDGVKPKILGDSDEKLPKRGYNIVFTTQTILLEVITKHLSAVKDLTDFVSHIFYFIPNRIPYDLNVYMNLKLLEVSRSILNLNIPKVTLFAVNTASIPKTGAKYTVFNKHTSTRPVSYEVFGKVGDNLYEEMARWILRTHMEAPGKTILVVVPTKGEIDNISNLLSQVSTAYLREYNIYDTDIALILETSPFVTKVVLATEETLPLVTVSVDVLLDSYRNVVSGKTLSGLETTFVIPTPKDVALNRATILRRPQDPEDGFDRNRNTVGIDVMMTSLNGFEGANLTPTQSISKYLLMIGLTSLHPLDVWPHDTTVHEKLVELQSYGALNPDYHTTSLGEFLLDMGLSPSEGAVLWTYLQEYWHLGKSCLAVMLLTGMVSLFSESKGYFVYNLPLGSSDRAFEERKYKREKWDKFAGADDIETFLNVWFHLIADVGTFELDYKAIEGWCRENSMNSDKMYAVYEKVGDLKESIKKYGFVCDEDVIEVGNDVKNLRKIYSKVYLLRRMKNIGSGIYQSIADQQTYTIYRRNSVNTVSITDPPEIVGVITKNKYILMTCLQR